MIRRGRQAGWLRLESDVLGEWAKLQGIQLNRVRVGRFPGREEQGNAVIAAEDIPPEFEEALMTIPREYILSKERVEIQAKADPVLRAILDALGDFAQSPRGATLTFLLHQVSIANPAIPDSFGLRNPFTDYFKFLPDESLPTSWTDQENALFQGTTLKPAMEQKRRSLQREFDVFRSRTSTIDWCARYWWSGDGNGLDLLDWLDVDAVYRSRAMEYPGIGDALAPCIDMANHAANDATAALYETDEHGNSVLVMLDGRSLKAGEEVTITYGDRKGACEMIFSYGFVDVTARSARVLFLNLFMQDDDPLAQAKDHVSMVAPGVRIYESEDGTIEWDSDYVWLIIVNEEDGLEFKVLQRIDGGKELKVFWKNQELTDTSGLRALLETDRMWDVFRLRATALISGRVDAQMQLLQGNQHVMQTQRGSGTNVRERVYQLAVQLRELEGRLLNDVRIRLTEQTNRLLASDTVQRYLAENSAESSEE